ncbi:MAG: hypothetical protein E4H14_15265, partial [Candidatus Thorarchaeota archaeon]
MIRIDKVEDNKDLRELVKTLEMEKEAKDNVLNMLDSGSDTLLSAAFVDNRLIALCSARFLEWDSDFFEQRSYQIEITSLNPLKLSGIHLSMLVESTLNALIQKNAEFVSARVDVRNGSYIRVLESHGFLTYDLTCIFAARCDNLIKKNREYPPGFVIRGSSEEDLWSLIALSANAFSYDRFHEDPGFGKERADAMHGIWVRNLHYSDISKLVVAELKGNIVGY